MYNTWNITYREMLNMSEQKYLKYCPKCAEIDDMPGAKYHVNGYKDYYASDAINLCLQCGSKLIQLSMLCEDYEILTHISTEPSFMESMVKLHDEDPIEYQLKMSRFRAQLRQQDNNNQDKNTVKCPRCGSTNIQVLRRWSPFGHYATDQIDRICVNCKCRF